MFRLLPLIFSFFLVAAAETPPPTAPVPGQPSPSWEETSEPPNYEHAFGKMILTLLGLILLIILAVWVMRRLSSGRLGQGGGHSIKILEKRALSPKSMLYLVEIDDKQVLLSESQLEVRTITHLSESKTE